MRKRDGHVPALTAQRDRKRSAAEQSDRLDETTHLRPQLVSDAVAGPARPHVSRRERGAVRETGVLTQGDDPGTPVWVDLPRGCQAGTHTSMAVHSDQRLVELAEQQSLAFV